MRTRCLLALALILTVLVGTPSPSYARAERAGAVTRVLAISVDGLNPDALRRLGRSGAPTFWRLLDEGASTLNARTEYEQTVTLPNHTSMMTGRRITASKGGHGVTWDDDRPGSTVQQAAGGPVSSVFDVVRDAGGSTALFTTKPKFALYDRSWTIDEFHADVDQTALVKAARSDLLHADRAFTFLHVSLPDQAGHEHGFMTPAYVRAVQQTDRLLAKLVRAIENRPALKANLAVVLTADHGGIGVGHADRTRLGNYRIPFTVWGGPVAAANLYELNPAYRAPGQRRPAYGNPRQPIRNGDVANVVTSLLGLGEVPGSQLGAGLAVTAS